MENTDKYEIAQLIDSKAFADVLKLYLQNWSETYEVPGLRTVIQQGSGTLIDFRIGEMLSEDKLLIVGSISKVLISYILLTLVRKKVLNLDETVSSYISELANTKVGNIQVYKLLNHSSGLSRDGVWQSTFNSDYPTEAELLNYLRSLKTLRDCNWGYSNIGFELARIVLERVTKRDYKELVKKYTGAFLKSGTFNADGILYDGYSRYDYSKKKRRRVKKEDFKGMYSSLSYSLNIHETQTLLKKYVDTFNEVISDRKYFMNRSPEPNWELGVSSWEQEDSQKIYDHQGEVWGYTSKVTYIPTLNIGITTFINCSLVPIYQLHQSLISSLQTYTAIDGDNKHLVVKKYWSRQISLIAIIGEKRVIFLRESLTNPFGKVIVAEMENKDSYRVRFGAETSFYGEKVDFIEGYKLCKIGPYLLTVVDK